MEIATSLCEPHSAELKNKVKSNINKGQMKNYKQALVAAVATAAIGCLSQSAMAVLIPVTGNIEFNNSATTYMTQDGSTGTPTPGLGTAANPSTQIDSVTGDTVTAATGSFVPTLNDPVVFNTPIVYIPPTGDNPFWTVNNGVDTFVFTASSMNAAQLQYANNIVSEVQLGGSGYVDEYSDLGGLPDITSGTLIGTGSGTWTLELQDQGNGTYPGDILTFQSGASTAAVPDGGTTLIMLGGVVTALAGLSKMRSKLV